MAKKAVSKTRGSAASGGSGRGGARRTRASSTIDDVRELVQLMVDNDLNELDIQEGCRKILLRRGVSSAAAAPVPAAAAAVSSPAAEAEAKEKPQVAEQFTEIRSPMVGTFYAAAGPDSKPFISVGDIVGADDVVGIVEAMKVMNEIKADCAGAVAEICVKNAQPVEFGQVLFRVKGD